MNYGPINKKMKSMIHGGDYNPEQWIDDKKIWEEDIRMMNLSRCNTMTIGIFSWIMLEPEEGRFDFGWMDEVMDSLSAAGKYAVVATPSGARPVWMSQKYPEVLRVNSDRRRNLHGERHNHCYTSPVYREKTRIINEKLAERYKGHPALLAWHISNEFGGECHCDLCQNAFREWLKVRYGNDLDRLNKAWWTTFWSHKYTDWSQIESPSEIGERSVHGLMLDWKRFVTFQSTDFMMNEMEPIRKITPDVPVTTNFMEAYEGIDYREMSRPLDIVSWDSYTKWHKEKNETDTAVRTAFFHDTIRSLKGGRPFMLMESTPSTTNWQEVSKLKRPGMHLLSSMQAVAHGSDTVQYFQWRKSRGSFEKLHGAVVDHCGHEHTRVFRDVTQVGEALSKLDEVVGTSVGPEVAIIFDWENWWALEAASGINNNAKNYYETLISHYRPFWERGVPVDVIGMEYPLDRYKIVIAPMLYMVKEKAAQNIERFVKEGGTFCTTYVSGVVDENDLCFLGGFPGPLKNVMGIWAEETDGLYPDDENIVNVSIEGMEKKAYSVREMCDLIHAGSARVLGRYAEDFYAGREALTENKYGSGRAYYIAFRNNADFERDFYGYLIDAEHINTVLPSSPPEGISVQARYDEKNKFVFIMNFSKKIRTVKLEDKIYYDVLDEREVQSEVTLNEYGVKILKVKR